MVDQKFDQSDIEVSRMKAIRMQAAAEIIGKKSFLTLEEQKDPKITPDEKVGWLFKDSEKNMANK